MMTRLSRGDKTAIELFLAGIRGWEVLICRGFLSGNRIATDLNAKLYLRYGTMSISRIGNPSCPPHQLQRIVRRVQSFARFDQTPKRREVGLQPSVPTSPLIAGITILGNLLRNVVVARPLETLDCNPPAVTATRGIRAPNLSHRVRR